MGDYNDSNSGALFKNDRRQKNTHPHYRGEVKVTCPHCGEKSTFWLSAWIKDMKQRAGKFMSLALTMKEEEPKAPATDEDFDDDIPF